MVVLLLLPADPHLKVLLDLSVLLCEVVYKLCSFFLLLYQLLYLLLVLLPQHIDVQAVELLLLFLTHFGKVLSLGSQSFNLVVLGVQLFLVLEHLALQLGNVEVV